MLDSFCFKIRIRHWKCADIRRISNVWKPFELRRIANSDSKFVTSLRVRVSFNIICDCPQCKGEHRHFWCTLLLTVGQCQGAHLKSSSGFWKNEKDLEEQQNKPENKDKVVWVNHPIDSPVQCRGVAANSNINETIGCCSSQMAKKHIRCLLERKGNKQGS